MSAPSIWLIGASTIAQNYALVLTNLNHRFEVICRSESSALLFEKITGQKVRTGGLKVNLKKDVAPEIAIVAVGIEQLANVTEDLIRAGTKRILLEKPGALNLEEIYSLNSLANEKNVEVLIAYNRRFYHSVQQLQKFKAVPLKHTQSKCVHMGSGCYFANAAKERLLSPILEERRVQGTMFKQTHIVVHFRKHWS